MSDHGQSTGPCCLMRKKSLIHLVVLREGPAGVPPDSILADFLRFDLPGPPKTDGTPGTMPVVCFKFCPWCAAPFVSAGFATFLAPVEDTEGEEWKQGGDGT